MELAQFLKSKITEFINYKISLKNKPLYQVRSEEMGVFSRNANYESKISNYMNSGKVIQAKKLYKELLDKFSSDLNRDVAIKLVDLLEKITNIIKNQLQGYEQEVIMKPEFERFNNIIETRRLSPSTIKGDEQRVSFFQDSTKNNSEYKSDDENSTKKILKAHKTSYPRKHHAKTNKVVVKKPKRKKSSIQYQEQIVKRFEPKKILPKIEEPEELRYEKPRASYKEINIVDENTEDLLKNIEITKDNIEKAIRNQDLKVAVETYKILRGLFHELPDETQEIKSELFSDILSINLRIHILAKEINRIRTNLVQKERYRRTIEKLAKIKKEKELMEEGLYAKEPVNTERYKEFLSQGDIENTQDESKDNLQKLRDEARNSRLNHDKEVCNSREEINPKRVLSSKNRLIGENNNVQSAPKQKKRKEIIIKDLYAKGLKRIFEKDVEKARSYFEKILEINPNYKPARIRLEQIS